MSNDKATPAKTKLLVKDKDGKAMHEKFNNASIVGLMVHLAGHLRPAIAYTVKCAARYMFSPKGLQEEALKQIGRYLKPQGHVA